MSSTGTMSIPLESIRAALEGAMPGTLATASADGMPNLAQVAHVQYVDSQHIALPCQFFNQTRRNLQAHPQATLALTDPFTGALYRLGLEYVRSDADGALFGQMRARFAALASHTGLSGMFTLQCADVFRVLAISQAPGATLPAPPARRNMLAALRRATERIRLDAGLDALLEDTLAALESEFGIRHAMALLFDEARGSLACAAVRGYGAGGPPEIALGAGVIGVAAQERTPIRIGHMNSEYGYHRAIRASTVECGFGVALGDEIALPGLPEPRSQMALPMLGDERLIGVLYVESTLELRFTCDDEDALAVLAAQLGQDIEDMQASGQVTVEAAAPPVAASGDALVVKHFAYNDSVFLGEDYLIKGVAGSIFATLVADCIQTGRTEFSNRELRLDPRVRLPGLSDNLEARLLLLSRRLDERSAPVRIEKTGRGRFKLCASQPLKLVAG
ncbi:MAG: GAF domain-containing protein [Gammaproteobacteria bacterium]